MLLLQLFFNGNKWMLRDAFFIRCGNLGRYLWCSRLLKFWRHTWLSLTLRSCIRVTGSYLSVWHCRTTLCNDILLDSSHFIDNQVFGDTEISDLTFGYSEEICVELMIFRVSWHVIAALLLEQVDLVFYKALKKRLKLIDVFAVVRCDAGLTFVW